MVEHCCRGIYEVTDGDIIQWCMTHILRLDVSEDVQVTLATKVFQPREIDYYGEEVVTRLLQDGFAVYADNVARIKYARRAFTFKKDRADSIHKVNIALQEERKKKAEQ